MDGFHSAVFEIKARLGFPLRHQWVLTKVPGYIARWELLGSAYIVHQNGKIHFRIFHQLLCLDPSMTMGSISKPYGVQAHI